jgi:hypothetical protein
LVIAFFGLPRGFPLTPFWKGMAQPLVYFLACYCR